MNAISENMCTIFISFILKMRNENFISKMVSFGYYTNYWHQLQVQMHYMKIFSKKFVVNTLSIYIQIRPPSNSLYFI